MFLQVKIRPKWDWNREHTAMLPSEGLVKIRPKWDWNVAAYWIARFTSEVKIRPKWDWNYPHKPCRANNGCRLKSDQNGIEINFIGGFKGQGDMLKSDQNGIEIFLSTPYLSPPTVVKIRPKWDWNIVNSATGSAPSPGLKSDQNGIEIIGWGTGSGTSSKVKIRPKWDWNCFVEDLAEWCVVG